MDPLSTQVAPRAVSSAPGNRVRTFRATDAFVIEAYRLTTALEGPLGRDLAREIRRIVARCGGAIVAASSSGVGPSGEQSALEDASRTLAAGRYYLYLARRLGLIDLGRYRALMSRHDSATRELDQAIASSPPARSRDPS